MNELTPPFRWDEPARLQALQNSRILDTSREQAFDDIVRMAALVCSTPMAAVVLIGSDRLTFKAEIGIGLSEMALGESNCARMIFADGVSEVVERKQIRAFATHRR
jgi:ABC-type iron transport system FetAB permease component